MTHDPTVQAPGDAATPLFDMFAPASYEAWRAAAEKTLKGVPFEKKLLTKTYEGLQLQPIYNAADVAELPQVASLPGQAPFLRGTQAEGYLAHPWMVAQELPYPTASAVNQAAHEDLPRGLSMLHVILDQASRHGFDPDQAPVPIVGQGGTSLASSADLLVLLEGIDLAKTPIRMAAGTAGLPLLALLLATYEGDPADLRGGLLMDPLAVLAAHGALQGPLAQNYDELAALTAWALEHAPHLQTIEVATHPYHNAGASVVQDLAFALATGVAYLRAMQERGLEVNRVAPRMQFAFSVGAPFFIEMARLRAARMLWARIVAAFGGDEQAQRMHIHARTSAWTKTRNDAYNNMLRATSEAFAAVMGGCTSLHVSPFDEPLGLPDEFSRRVARNVQIILQEECHFVRLIDPAGGAWAVEKLTDEIARLAWTLFQEVEGQGGMVAALAAGLPQTQITATRHERFSQIGQRREVIIGANMFVNLKEQQPTARTVDYAALQVERSTEVGHLRAARDPAALQSALAEVAGNAPQVWITGAVAAARLGATIGELAVTLRGPTSPTNCITPLPAHRASEQFEALRQNAEQYAARTGARPSVFLAGMGPLAQHKARADFATGFFEAGGFAVISGSGFTSPEEAAEAAQASGAPIVVICATDDRYPELVPPLTKLLKTANPETTVILAGYPSEQLEAHRAAGVDEFIHLRADCYAILAHLQQTKGVAS
ncbi:methylmalonyl-CoA mutase family protein [Candidatus Viridilinea mediisalina]|uniref:Methylmalonyl-CoA mutase n=1 Tax=Candidatus Viridilinea mediisalina TaxID=2024553 RepID=A0A2A6RLU7_9CHLR|nr:methylmalonyl-CoA mutase family protein [Candidatus Viridilinea mediisalina]PDW04042.1 methylmalonyl-CoA mutase [Candidatus Viridilinea mediisalina]